MGFDGLLGNEQLKKDLSGSLRLGKFSHCYLISGPAGSGKRTLANLLAAAVLCTGNNKPCMSCQSCRKVTESNHPDFITVDDTEKKTVSVELVRWARSDVYIQPNESDHKVYLFPRAQDMGIAAQNALLKVLEEPPGYAVFILLADNPEKLLPTVRSRCRELKLTNLSEGLLLEKLAQDFPQASPEDRRAAAARSGGFLGQARQLLQEGSAVPPQTQGFVKGFGGRDRMELVQTLVPMEKWKRDALIPMLESWLQLLEEALCVRSGGQAVSPLARQLSAQRSSAELYRGIGCLRKAVEYAQGNVSPGAVCGWLLWELQL